jgi:hypothetical protein
MYAIFLVSLSAVCGGIFVVLLVGSGLSHPKGLFAMGMLALTSGMVAKSEIESIIQKRRLVKKTPDLTPRDWMGNPRE